MKMKKSLFVLVIAFITGCEKDSTVSVENSYQNVAIEKCEERRAKGGDRRNDRATERQSVQSLVARLKRADYAEDQNYLIREIAAYKNREAVDALIDMLTWEDADKARVKRNYDKENEALAGKGFIYSSEPAWPLSEWVMLISIVDSRGEARFFT